MHQPAPFFRRLAARLLDLVFCLLLTFVLAVPVAVVLVLLSPVVAVVAPDSAYDVGFAVAVICYFVTYVGLEVFLLVRRDGQTLGKGLLGLRVVPSSGRPLEKLRLPPALARMLVIFMPFVFMSMAGGNPESAGLNALASVGALTLLASLVLAAIPRTMRRTLHDLVAGSRVVRASVRQIDWKQDVRMALPGKLDLTKRP
jgi:uncharacterized RDD family membrane protein YckC